MAALLDGAVIIAHNARYDTELLSAGFAPDDLLCLCTLTSPRRFGRPTVSHRLAECAAAYGFVRSGVQSPEQSEPSPAVGAGRRRRMPGRRTAADERSAMRVRRGTRYRSIRIWIPDRLFRECRDRWTPSPSKAPDPKADTNIF
ncbi:hypothetical protein Ppa06_39520 [Planomonospora parontospora subsp. parontospora]|uniref:Exonuclease domain-containing protein n=2 Tax=Planomonospora parontospora TaxID=58119 RepID=A0AA37BIH1_9ACTN|nr:hypothetical protein GCM10010126_39400 [Planomonospora parontospora]GII10154.1 hypothetical protein Ppa06_39520 [Planomonospora parontospora subsp. parontospora]